MLDFKIKATSHGYVSAYRDLTITYTVSKDAEVPDFVIVIPEFEDEVIETKDPALDETGDPLAKDTLDETTKDPIANETTTSNDTKDGSANSTSKDTVDTKDTTFFTPGKGDFFFEPTTKEPVPLKKEVIEEKEP